MTLWELLFHTSSWDVAIRPTRDHWSLAQTPRIHLSPYNKATLYRLSIVLFVAPVRNIYVPTYDMIDEIHVYYVDEGKSYRFQVNVWSRIWLNLFKLKVEFVSVYQDNTETKINVLRWFAGILSPFMDKCQYKLDTNWSWTDHWPQTTLHWPQSPQTKI